MSDDKGCLEEGEISEYTIDDQKNKATSTITIYVKDKNTNTILRQFTEPILQPGHYHPVELRKCAAYFMQGTNYDPRSPGTIPPVGFRVELAAFDYLGPVDNQTLTCLGMSV